MPKNQSSDRKQPAALTITLLPKELEQLQAWAAAENLTVEVYVAAVVRQFANSERAHGHELKPL